MKKATYIKQLNDFTGDARLYHMEPPHEGHEYVIVSATTMAGSPETYIFPSNEQGEIVDWGELDGSFQGRLDHAEALANAEYSIG